MFTQAEDVLRMRGWAAAAALRSGALRRAALLTLLFGLAYGAVMGTYAGWAGNRPWDELLLQMAYSALKVPLLLAATCLVALPSFFVLNTLLGLRDDFHLAIRAVAATQAGVAIILASLAPLTLTWYLSSEAYYPAILFNAAMFALASVAAQRLLRGHYRALIARNPRHRTMLRTWLFLYALVGIQMAWMLRPFVGSRSDPVEFYRKESLDNAYVIVARLFWEALR
jgi:ABC-type dipeptide/oligopeptide/nickel transport system permease subunit